MQLKICFLSTFDPESEIGGVESHIRYLYNYLKKIGLKVDIIIPRLTSTNELNNHENNSKITYLNIDMPIFIEKLKRFSGDSFLGKTFALFFRLIFLLKHKYIALEIIKRGYLIVHQHDFIANLLTMKILKKKGLVCILTNHTGEFLYLQKIPFSKYIIKSILRYYDTIIGPSIELTPKNYHQNAIYIPNGVDLSFFHPIEHNEKNNIKIKLGIKDKFIVLCPRRWAPTKGIIYLLKAINQWNDAPDDIVFLFAGNKYKKYPQYVKKLYKIIKQMNNNLRKKIILLGNLPHETLRVYYQISDVVIIPSLMEATSLSALEAMACGVPVIASNVGGMKEIIRNLENGILIPPRSSKDIINSIKFLYQNRDILDNMRKKAFDIAQNYSWDKIAHQVYNVYLEAYKKMQGGDLSGKRKI